MLVRIIALLAVGIFTSSPATQEDPDRLEIADLLDWESVSDPVLSPDGTQVVFRRRWVDKVHDRYVSELWIMDADGSRPRFLVRGSSPKFSPSGDRLAFLADGEPKGSQIHVMWIDTREVTQVTRVEQSPSSLAWAPDGRSIAFSMVVREKPVFEIELPKRPKGAEWAEEPKIISRLAYRRDRQGYRPKGWRHLFVVDADGGTPRQVTDGDFDHGGAEWTTDGRFLVFGGLREDDADWQVRESEIYKLDIGTGAVTALTTRAGPDGNPAVSPDGRLIAYTGHDATRDTYEVRRVHVMDVDGGNVRVLAPDLDRQPSDLMWTKDSRSILCVVEIDGTRQLYRIGLDGSATAITNGQHMFRAGDVGRDGTVVGTLTDPRQPGDIVRVDPSEGTILRLTRVHDDVLHGVALGAVEEIRYASPADGLEIQGWIVKPPDFDPGRKYPLILQIHGGPHGMYGADFSFERQNHAANGYVVLYTNPRGSSGYGKTFGNAILNAYPGKDYDDLMGGVDAVIERGYVDREKLFVYGGSGGGVLTAWIVGHTDRFAGAVSMYPVINWISFVGTTDGPFWYTNFARLPWEDVTEHWERSPLKYVGNVTTPTLLLTGELDLRTPMSQTEEFYQALKLRKVDTLMIRIPGEYHGAAGRRPSNLLRRILYVREWFERHMPDHAAAADRVEAAHEKDAH